MLFTPIKTSSLDLNKRLKIPVVLHLTCYNKFKEEEEEEEDYKNKMLV